MLNHPLTAPLPARSGKTVVTPEGLLNLPQQEAHPILRWLGNTHLLYSSPPLNSKQTPTIEMLDVHTGERTVLGGRILPNAFS